MIDLLYTSEQVSVGHPDKIADQISDAIVQYVLEQDKRGRVAVETLVKGNHIILAGEVTTTADMELEALKGVVNTVLYRIGDDRLKYNANVTSLIATQSPDIAQGVDTGGAGDQGIMFGYATRETEAMLPLAFVLATEILSTLYDKVVGAKHKKPSKFEPNEDDMYRTLGIDAKSQITLYYDGTGRPWLHTALVSTQHSDNTDMLELRNELSKIIIAVAKNHNVPILEDFIMLINPTGRFVIGGSYADAGVTGRKIIADTYGGYALHGGGAFSGKDPSKVDRSAAYMARHIAKWGLANYFNESVHEVTIQLSYAIGVATPLSVTAIVKDIKGNTISDGTRKNFEASVCKEFDLTPKGIIEYLDLLNTDKIDYYKTARFGHFKDKTMPWEKV